MTQKKDSLIYFKERLVYEMAISLGLNPESLNLVNLPDFEDPLYNVYLVLKRNLDILKDMKEA
jgi:hypothetical protein